MKKKLLSSLFAVALLGGTVNAQSEMCMPEVDFQSYACISKVELNGVVSESSAGVPGETMFSEDYTEDAARLFTVEAGQTYTLTVTFSNFNSGATDFYQMTAFFDWNNDKVFQASERCTDQRFSAGRSGGFITKTFEITVPADAVIGKVHMRVLAFYYEDGYPSDPCDWFESGNQEDYLIEVTEGTVGIGKVKSDKVAVYPNPAVDVVNVASTVSEYTLYSVDGKLIQQGQPASQTINVAGNAPGMYILKMQTNEGTKVSNLIIK